METKTATNQKNIARPVLHGHTDDPAYPIKAARKRKLRAITQSAILAGLAVFSLVVWHKQWIGLILFILSAGMAACGFLAPKIFTALEKFGQRIGHMAGTALTWMLLVPFFYVSFTIGRILLLAARKDPLQRRFEREWKSYWVDRKPIRNQQYYTRQY